MLFGKKKKEREGKIKESIEQASQDIATAPDMQAALRRLYEHIHLPGMIEAVDNAPAGSQEQATKKAFIEPFIRALGYNVSDARVVVGEKAIAYEEFNTTIKVDYAISVAKNSSDELLDAKEYSPILIEAKSYTATKKLSCGAWTDTSVKRGRLTPREQLALYFDNTPEARLGILSNGVEYYFYANAVDATLNGRHCMAKRPFLKLDFSEDRFTYKPSVEYLCADNFAPELTEEYQCQLKEAARERVEMAFEQENWYSEIMVATDWSRAFSNLVDCSM